MLGTYVSGVVTLSIRRLPIIVGRSRFCGLSPGDFLGELAQLLLPSSLPVALSSLSDFLPGDMIDLSRTEGEMAVSREVVGLADDGVDGAGEALGGEVGLLLLPLGLAGAES